MAGKQYSPEMIPEVGVQLPSGRFMFKIEEMDDTQETSTGKYQIRTTLRVVEPTQFSGTPHYENFVIGNDKDPAADDPETWKSYPAGRYKQLLKKAGVEPSGDVEADTAAATEQLVGGLVIQSIEPQVTKDGHANPYAGRIRSQTQAFFRPGERETGLDMQQGQPSVTKPAGPRPVAMAPKPQTAKPATPVAPKAQPQPQVLAKPATMKKPQTLPCPICRQPVVREQLGAHVEEHQAGDTQEEE